VSHRYKYKHLKLTTNIVGAVLHPGAARAGAAPSTKMMIDEHGLMKISHHLKAAGAQDVRSPQSSQRPRTAMQQSRIVTGRDSGWGIAHGAVSRSPPISSTRWYPVPEATRTALGVWDLSLVQGPFSAAPC
jgi:hypothetical protein